MILISRPSSGIGLRDPWSYIFKGCEHDSISDSLGRFPDLSKPRGKAERTWTSTGSSPLSAQLPQRPRIRRREMSDGLMD